MGQRASRGIPSQTTPAVTCANCCAPVGIRTPNLLIRSQMLYPLSYRRSSLCAPVESAEQARRCRIQRGPAVWKHGSMPGIRPEDRELFEREAAALYEQLLAEGGMPADDPRVADDGPSRAAFDLLVRLGLVQRDDASNAWRPLEPSNAQSRVVTPLGTEGARLIDESARWASAFAGLSQSWRRSPVASESGPFLYLHGEAGRAVPHGAGQRRAGRAAHRAAAGAPQRQDRAGGDHPRRRGAQAWPDDAHALPAQRPAPPRARTGTSPRSPSTVPTCAPWTSSSTG